MKDRYVVIISCVIGVVVALLYYLSLITFDREIQDVKFRHFGDKQVSKELAIIKVDSETLKQVGKWPIKRNYWAMLVKILSEYKAKTTAIAVYFQDPDNTVEYDDIFEKEVKDAGNVFLPFYRIGENVCVFPIEKLKNAVKGLGFTNVNPDGDGTLRNINPFIKIDGKYSPFFGICFIPQANIILSEDVVFNLSRKEELFASYSLIDVLLAYKDAKEGRTPRMDLSVFRNKLVLVGLTASGVADFIPTCADKRTADLYVYANVSADILSEKFYVKMDMLSSLILIFAIGMLAGVMLLIFPNSKGVFYSIVCLIGFIVIDEVVFYSMRVIMPVFAISVSGVVSLFFCSIYVFAVRERMFINALKKEYSIRDVLVEGFKYGMILVAPDGKIEYKNKHFHNLIGVAEFGLGANVRKIFADERMLLYAIEKKETVEFEKRLGDEISYFKVNSFMISNPGKQDSLLVVIENVTREKKLQQHLQLKERLALIGEMAAGIAHEMRNPLGGIFMFLGLLEQEIGKHKYITRIKDEGYNLDNLIESFLQYAKPVSTDKITFDITALFDEAKQLLSKKIAEKKAVLILNIQKDDALIFADSNLFKQVMCNLVSNALDAIPEYGRININIQEENMNGKLFTKLSFFDNGSGISESDIRQLFIPFFTTKEKGIGLGLPIVSKIITAHNGEINVQSRVNEGTIVTVWFPKKNVPAMEMSKSAISSLG